MAKFNDLAVELQEAIWQLVLPQTRGIHWIELEGIPHEPDYIRGSIHMTEWHKFDRIPETYEAAFQAQVYHPEFYMSDKPEYHDTGPFFRRLLATVPAVFGRSGPDDNNSATGQNDSKQLPYDRADDIAYTRRCRQLSTYTQISTLLSTCRLSRLVAQQRVHDDSNFSWPLHRSMGPLYRPRPMDVWEAQYGGNKAPVISNTDDAELLAPSIHALDLVVFRLHDSQGRATPLLRHAAWQCGNFCVPHDAFIGCFDRIGIEWHPSWGTAGGRGELRDGNVQAIVRLMEHYHFPSFLCWLVDGVPRPDWSRDYPPVVREIFTERMAKTKTQALDHLKDHWDQSDPERADMVADHHLGQEFEGNGRRYYIVFVVICRFLRDTKQRLRTAGLGHRGPFPGSADLWPEAVREPAKLAQDVMRNSSHTIGTHLTTSYILSWEPI